LYNSGIGAGHNCLDVGCGTGLLGVQLALNGASMVTAIDNQQSAVTNTLANAFRNGVDDRKRGKVADLYALDKLGQFDTVVASLLQLPADPGGRQSGHELVDFWGRNLLDQLFSLLPQLLGESGVAYVMQSSVLSRNQTVAELQRYGLAARVLDFQFDRLPGVFMENMEQIRRVEDASDAYHYDFQQEAVMVMYLLEITRA
jgi:23S rRNA G2069 N7-methylase RlmK/C1962 C5-methylase RlmI